MIIRGFLGPADHLLEPKLLVSFDAELTTNHVPTIFQNFSFDGYGVVFKAQFRGFFRAADHLLEPNFLVSFGAVLTINLVPIILQNFSFDYYGVVSRPNLGDNGCS